MYILRVDKEEAIRGTYEEVSKYVDDRCANKDEAMAIMDSPGYANAHWGWVELIEEDE